MITKETFIMIMKAMGKEMDFIDAMNQLMEEHCEDGIFMRFGLMNAVLTMLEEMFNDEGEWLSYAMYELNMLKSYEHGMCTNDDGSVIDLSTWEKVYDFLVDNQ